MKTKDNKVIKIETLESHITYDLDGNLDDVIKYLQDLRERYQKDYFELYIDISYHHDDTDISLMGKREETKEEETSRLLKFELHQARIKEEELKQLEILKKKYEQ
jgi:hypothetical protein